MKTLFLLAMILFFLCGCGFFSRKVESIVEKEENKNQIERPIAVRKNLFCPDHSKTQFISEDESTLKFYSPFLKSTLENKSLGFIQRAALYSLAELVRRPDVVNPKARLQFFLRYKDKDFYVDIHPKNANDDSAVSYLKGIELLLKQADSTADLSKLAEVVDVAMAPGINVSPALEFFLAANRDEISKNEELTEVYFKGDEILTKHESFKKLQIKKLIAQYKNEKKFSDTLYSISEAPLKNYQTDSHDLNLKCNFNVQTDSVTKQDLLEAELKKGSHYFAMMEGNHFFIAAVSSVIPQKISNIKGTYFFNFPASPVPFPVCEYKTKAQDIILFSTKGRFPGQHLQHLLTYDIELADNQVALQEILTFSRHLFLSNPDRILYESKRGRKSQLDFFLSMNFPIYHVTSLGDLMGAATFSKSTQYSSSLIVDDRSAARLRCSY